MKYKFLFIIFFFSATLVLVILFSPFLCTFIYLFLSFPRLLYHFLSMPLHSSVEVDRLPPKSIRAVSVTISQKWYGLISILDSVSVCALLTQPIFPAECPTFQFDPADLSMEKS